MTIKGAEPRSQEVFTDREQVDEDNIDLRQYIKILRKHRWPIIAATALITGVTAWVVSGIAPTLSLIHI